MFNPKHNVSSSSLPGTSGSETVPVFLPFPGAEDSQKSAAKVEGKCFYYVFQNVKVDNTNCFMIRNLLGAVMENVELHLDFMGFKYGTQFIV